MNSKNGLVNLNQNRFGGLIPCIDDLDEVLVLDSEMLIDIEPTP